MQIGEGLAQPFHGLDDLGARHREVEAQKCLAPGAEGVAVAGGDPGVTLDPAGEFGGCQK